MKIFKKQKVYHSAKYTQKKFSFSFDLYTICPTFAVNCCKWKEMYGFTKLPKGELLIFNEI